MSHPEEDTHHATELDQVVVHSPASSASGTDGVPPAAHRELDNALELAWSDITIRHGDRKLLYGVSGKVKGRFLAIMGGSGSGKVWAAS